ncbi:hypothetical protein GCM10010315_19570 [Streptomyces luteosporeus]|uniref:Uncharacterized protein n=1 Tax=Streptomyces luteosporeus TaxID=173856 RepID=A0ABP6G471_9ACTN
MRRYGGEVRPGGPVRRGRSGERAGAGTSTPSGGAETDLCCRAPAGVDVIVIPPARMRLRVYVPYVGPPAPLDPAQLTDFPVILGEDVRFRISNPRS